MDFLVYGNRKCLWIRCMFGWRTLITIARVNCILGLMQVLMADCFSYVKQSVWKSLKKVSFYNNYVKARRLKLAIIYQTGKVIS